MNAFYASSRRSNSEVVVNGGGDCCAYNVASSCTAILDKSQVKMGVFKSPDKMLIYAVSCLFHVCMRASTDPLFMTTSMSRRERFIAFLLFLLAGALLLTSPRDVTSSDPALLVRTAVITCAMLVAIGILSGPLVHVEKQRDHAWEAERLAFRPDFEIYNHRGMYIHGRA